MMLRTISRIHTSSGNARTCLLEAGRLHVSMPGTRAPPKAERSCSCGTADLGVLKNSLQSLPGLKKKKHRQEFRKRARP